jgi:hypothetical protein
MLQNATGDQRENPTEEDATPTPTPAPTRHYNTG